MSLLTVEVEIENGIVRPCGADVLPAKARGFLTIVEPAQPEVIALDRSWGECLQHLCGIGNGEHTDLSTNKAHMEGFGK